MIGNRSTRQYLPARIPDPPANGGHYIFLWLDLAGFGAIAPGFIPHATPKTLARDLSGLDSRPWRPNNQTRKFHQIVWSRIPELNKTHLCSGSRQEHEFGIGRLPNHASFPICQRTAGRAVFGASRNELYAYFDTCPWKSFDDLRPSTAANGRGTQAAAKAGAKLGKPRQRNAQSGAGGAVTSGDGRMDGRALGERSTRLCESSPLSTTKGRQEKSVNMIISRPV